MDLTAEGSGGVTSNEASLFTLFSFKEALFNYVCFLWHLAYKLQAVPRANNFPAQRSVTSTFGPFPTQQQIKQTLCPLPRLLSQKTTRPSRGGGCSLLSSPGEPL